MNIFSLSFFSTNLMCYLVSTSLLLVCTSCSCNDTKKIPIDKNSNKEVASKEVASTDNLNVKHHVVKSAHANIKSFKDSAIKGVVVFTKVADGIKIVADIEGLSPGKHGFHIHETGDCSGIGECAGGHFNPDSVAHGGPDSAIRHVGDLGNLEADENKYAHYERVDSLISLDGKNSILNRSVIIHADPDDYHTQPTGNAGLKIACGVIKADND